MKPEPDQQDRILHLPRERDVPGPTSARLLHRTPPQVPGLFMAAPAMEVVAADDQETVRVSVKRPRRVIKDGA